MLSSGDGLEGVLGGLNRDWICCWDGDKWRWDMTVLVRWECVFCVVESPAHT